MIPTMEPLESRLLFSALLGDANYDGFVDGLDYTAWAESRSAADFDGNGDVDGSDYTAWAANYGLDYIGDEVAWRVEAGGKLVVRACFVDEEDSNSRCASWHGSQNASALASPYRLGGMAVFTESGEDRRNGYR